MHNCGILNSFPTKFLFKSCILFVIAGILLDYNNEENKKMFDYAIETANNDILAEDDFKLKGLVKEVPFGNEFQVAQNACQLLKVCDV